MRKSIKKMTYRNSTCLLAQNNGTYQDLFLSICHVLNDYLESRSDDMDLQNESRLNATLVAIFAMNSGHIAQCRSLQHFVSMPTLDLLPVIFFGSQEELQIKLTTASLDEVFTLLLYFMVATIKCSENANGNGPGRRGLEWLREKIRDVDLSWVGTDRRGRPEKFDGTGGPSANNQDGYMAEEFPILEA